MSVKDVFAPLHNGEHVFFLVFVAITAGLLLLWYAFRGPSTATTDAKETLWFWGVVFVPLLLLMDVPAFFVAVAPDESAAILQQQISAGEREFLLKQYQNAVEEIRLRIEQEHLLLVLKLTIVGTVLGVVFYCHKPEQDSPDSASFLHSELLALCAWASVAIATIVDVRLMFNTNIIILQGQWVRQVEQMLAPASGALGWEHFFGKSRMWETPISPLFRMDRQLLTWVLYVVTVYLFVRHAEPKRVPSLLRLARPAACLCIVLFGFVNFQYTFGVPYLWLYSCSATAVGIAVIEGWTRNLSKKWKMSNIQIQKAA